MQMPSKFATKEEARAWLMQQRIMVKSSQNKLENAVASGSDEEITRLYHELLLRKGAAIGIARALLRTGWIEPEEYVRTMKMDTADLVRPAGLQIPKEEA